MQQKDAYIRKLEARLLNHHKGPAGKAKSGVENSKAGTGAFLDILNILLLSNASHCPKYQVQALPCNVCMCNMQCVLVLMPEQIVQPTGRSLSLQA